MKRQQRASSLFLALLLLCLCAPCGASALDDAPDVISNAAELQVWLDAHADIDGAVTLGSNIELFDWCDLYPRSTSDDAANSVSIDTGEYGFIVGEGGVLQIGDRVRITGSGSTNTVIRIKNGGWFYAYGTSPGACPLITATGAGGRALSLEDGAEYLCFFYDSYMHFRAEGENSTAIESDVELDLRYHTIEATGAGARGIASSEPVSLYLSRVEAAGSSILAPEATLDTCAVSPAASAPELTIISRKITALYHPDASFAQIGSRSPGYVSALSPILCTATLASEDCYWNETEDIWIQLDDSNTSYDAIGVYLIPGALASVPSAYDIRPFDVLSDAHPLGINVVVYDPQAVPSFSDADLSAVNGGISLRYAYYGNIENLTLWRSLDGGDTWGAYWGGGWMTGDNFSAHYDNGILELQFYDEEEYMTPTLFVFYLETESHSNVLLLDLANGFVQEVDSRAMILPWDPPSGEPENPNGPGSPIELNDDVPGGDRDYGDRTAPSQGAFTLGGILPDANAAAIDASASAAIGTSPPISVTGGTIDAPGGAQTPASTPAPLSPDASPPGLISGEGNLVLEPSSSPPALKAAPIADPEPLFTPAPAKQAASASPYLPWAAGIGGSGIVGAAVYVLRKKSFFRHK